MPVWLIVLIVVIAVLVIAFIVMYNNMVQLKNRCKNAWSQTDVQLQRRHDLIPNLVETVKGYAAHEKSTLDAVISARNACMASADPATAMRNENILSNTLRSLFAVAEAYPDLKANQNFLELQKQLTETEDRLSYARQSYNDCVMAFDNAREQFPSNLVCALFSANFKAFDLFDAPTEAKSVPNVSF